MTRSKRCPNLGWYGSRFCTCVQCVEFRDEKAKQDRDFEATIKAQRALRNDKEDKNNG